MPKTVTIPAYLSRMEITINNHTYSYAGGATVTVPDEVAALIESNEANRPSGMRAVEAPVNAAKLYTGDDYIPVYTDRDGVLRVRKEDILETVGAQNKDPFVVTFTVSSGTVTPSATVAQIYAAIKAGRVVLGEYAGVQLQVIGKTTSSTALTAITFQNAIQVTANVLTIHTFAYSSSAWSTTSKTYTLTATT